MTPKNKAKELVYYFTGLLDQSTVSYISALPKVLATKCVEEIMATNPKIETKHEKNNCVWFKDESNIEYWNDVLIEIDCV